MDPPGENDGENDNRPLAREILALRNEQARLHGCESYREYALIDRNGPDADAVSRLLAGSGSRRKPGRRQSAMPCAHWRLPAAQPTRSRPWDWRYYAEKVRKARYDSRTTRR